MIGSYLGADRLSHSFVAELARFASGTLICTPMGDIAVESLQIDDLVLTADGKAAAICWIGWRRVFCRHHPRPEAILPIRILANAFGHGRSLRDLAGSHSAPMTTPPME